MILNVQVVLTELGWFSWWHRFGWYLHARLGRAKVKHRSPTTCQKRFGKIQVKSDWSFILGPGSQRHSFQFRNQVCLPWPQVHGLEQEVLSPGDQPNEPKEENVNLIAMASTLRALASNPIVMASNLIAMA